MIFSLKLYESGPKAWREVGGPWRIRMTNRFSNRFSFSVLSFYAKQFFCLSWFRSCDVLKGLWSLSFVNDAECHYESTGVGVGVFFTLETGRTLSHKLEGIGDSRIKTFPFSSHFTWLRRFRSSEKQIENGSGRINKAIVRQQCSISPLEKTLEEKFDFICDNSCYPDIARSPVMIYTRKNKTQTVPYKRHIYTT